MGINLYDLLEERARQQPAHPAILGPAPDECLSYGALADAIHAASQNLRALGVDAGATIGLHCPSGVQYIIANYAAWRCGATVVPMPTELAPPEKVRILQTVKVEWVVSHDRSSAFLDPYRRGDTSDVLPGVALTPVERLREHPAGFSDLQSAFIRFTSGTTASAKGVVLSHRTIHERILAANDALQLDPSDRIIWPLSMAYHFAVSIVAYLSFGATMVLLPDHFGEAIFEAAQRHRATMIYGSPTHYRWLANTPAKSLLPDVRLAISTTSPLDPQTAEQFEKRFGLALTQALGIIEIGLPFVNIHDARLHPEAVGRALPAYRLRLDDVGLGPRLKEVALAGPGLLDAYYDPWQPRARIMPDGWFRTGDVGEVDDNGCLFLRGRTKDLISILGKKFFPQEVEAVLCSHPAIESARVFTQPDARLGDVPQAQVVLKKDVSAPPTQRELMQYCRTQLADFKVPQQITVVQELPRTASGKVLHRNAD